MGQRLIHTASNTQTVADQGKGEIRVAKVYRDVEWDEYRVTFYIHGERQINADYHTGDKEDAKLTANHWVSSGHRPLI